MGMPVDELVRIKARPHPFARPAADFTAFLEGGSVADVLDGSGLRFRSGVGLQVYVNGRRVPREHYETMRPCHGDTISVLAVPGRGGGKDTARIVATIAIVAAAAWSGGAAAGFLGLTKGFAYSAVYAGVAAGVSYAGLALLNAIAPPPRPSVTGREQAAESQSFGIQGGRNRLAQWGVIPQPLGEHRFYPPYGAKPYTEVAGGDQYLRLLFLCGYAPMAISGLKIGETALEDFQDVEVYVHEDFAPTDTLKLFTDDVDEQALGVTLKESDGFNLRTTGADVEEISLDITAPQGLVEFNGQGDKVQRTVDLDVQYAPYATEWAPSTPYALGDHVEPVAASWAASTPYALGDYIRHNGQLLECTTAGTSGSAEPDWTYENGDTVSDGATLVWTVRHFRYECTTAGESGGAEPTWPTTPGATVSDNTVVWTCRSWSVDRFGRAFAQRAVTTDDVSSGIMGSTRWRYDRILLNRYSGELVYRKGHSYSSAAYARPPSVPPWAWPVCKIFRDSTKANVEDADITDERPDELIEGGASYFLPHADSPASDDVIVDAGTLFFRPGFSAKRTSIIRKNYTFPVAAGRYDVRIRRATADSENQRIVDTVVWSVLREIRHASPIASGAPNLTLVEMRIRATGQLNGIIDRFSCVGVTRCADWDSGTETWVTRETVNCASLYRHVLQGAANKRPLADAALDLGGIEAWHEDCVANGFSFNQYIDARASVEEVLKNIASAGRASPAYRDGKHTVVMDRERTTPVQVFTPRDSWNFRAEKNFVDPPHAFRVFFPNREKDWVTDERIVYDDGYTEANATKFESLDFPGVTDEDLVWKHGRFHIAQYRLRPETYQWESGIKQLICTRGDLVGVQHDVTLWGVASGRVRELYRDGNGDVAGVLMDEEMPMEAGKSYGVAFGKSDGSMITANVATEPGAPRYLLFSAPIAAANAPAKGDLGLFGLQGSEYAELIVTAIRPHNDMTATITAVDHSPAVHSSDTGTIPPFDSRMTAPPGSEAPVIDDVRSDEEVLIRAADGTLNPAVLITFALTANRPLHEMSHIEGQYRPSGNDGAYIELPPVVKDAGEVSIASVEQGETYDIRFRFRYLDGSAGPWTDVENHTVVGKSTPPADVSGFNAVFQKNNALLYWNHVADRDRDEYEIRYGADWDTADFVARIKGTSREVAVPAGTSHTFLVKAIDTSGNYSTAAALQAVTVSMPTVSGITTQVIDNTVLLRWTSGDGSFPCSRCEIRKGPVFASAEVVGTSDTDFATVFETASGDYTYWIVPTDTVGNKGTEQQVTASVDEPPDFILASQFETDWTGASGSLKRISAAEAYAPVDVTETYQAHFTTRSWASPEDQVNAGYPIYIQPTPSSAYYEDEYDAGAVLAGSRIVVSLTSEAVAGTVTVTPKISVRKLPTDPWTDFTAGDWEVFATDFRYVKVRLDFASAAGADLLRLKSMTTVLRTKVKTDEGEVTVSSNPCGVTFNKSFVDIRSINATPQGTAARTAVVDFTDVPNPTGFDIHLFDSSGSAATGTVRWTARGV